MKARSLIIILCTITIGAAQGRDGQSGSISGTVYNETTREPVAGASVQVLSTTTGAATDIDGRFTISPVAPGNYQLRVSAIGFATHTHTDIVVAAGRQTTVNVGIRESVLEFEGVTVSAEYFQNDPNAPVSVQTLDAEEVRRLPGGLEDVVRAISILPGVAQASPGRNDLIVRGGAPSENLYIVDNIELSNINHFGTQGSSGGPLSYINLDYVSETTFNTGGFGVRYGDKVSSVLTIDLSNGRTDHIGGKATIASSQFGVGLEGPAGENGSFIVSVRRSYLDFIFKAAGFGFVPEYWDVLAKARYAVTPSDQVTVIGIGALDRVKLFNDTGEKRYDNSRLLDNDQNQVAGGATWRHLFSNGFTSLTVSHTYNDYLFQQRDTLLVTVFRSSSIERESAVRGEVVYQFSPLTEVTAGVTGKTVGIASDIILPSFRSPFGQTVSVNRGSGLSGVKAAGYVQFSQSMMSNVRLTAGGRIDHFSLIEDDVAFSPRCAISVAVQSRITVNASIGSYTQSPSLIWLASNAQNNGLKFIRVGQYIAGIDYLLRDDIKLSVEAYRKNYRDYPASTVQPFLVLANTGAGFGGSMDGYSSFGLDPLVSAGTGWARGIDLFFQKKLSEVPWYGLLSVSYSISRFAGLDGVERPGSFDQRWIVNTGGGYVINEEWEVSGKFRFATGQPYTPFNADGTQSAALYNSRRVRANHSLDLRVDKRWNFDGWNLITYLDIQNVYDREYRNMPRYDVRTGTEVQDGSIGLLPSIGISGEF